MTVKVPVPKMLKSTVGFISWGLQDSEHGFDNYSNDPVALVSEMKGDGFWGSCIQVLDKNLDGGIALHESAKAAGFHFGGWQNIAQDAGDLDQLHHAFDTMRQMKIGFMHWNVEERWNLGGTQLDNPDTVNNCHKVLCSEARKAFPKMPMAVQTNGGGFELRAKDGSTDGRLDQAAAKIYNDHQIWCNHEDYWVNNENLTPSGGDFWAHDGYKGTGAKFRKPSASTAGIFGSETGRTAPDGSRLFNTILMEIPRLAASGRHQVESVWTIEYMTRECREHVGARF